ncbi:type II secretion system F family protein [Microterricola viridarii]|uniref:Tight adherence protein B n=1 Tax=Microterricola viridarii TaxID=412690 RepID=A0A1H1Z0I9_9MICO|nr:type II secretion system F family protein [Microterricola viridarii]SDT27178.1 tight adherence protein B [Microterricola viridarii]
MSTAEPPIEAVAAVTERLAVLLAAGVSPHAAWRYLAEEAAEAGQGLGAAGEPRPGHAGSRAHRATHLSARVHTRFGARSASEVERMTALTATVVRAAARAGAQGRSIPEAIRAAVAAKGGTGTAPSAGSEPATRPGRTGRTGRELRSERAWLALAAAWFVAGEAGAPLAATLRELATAFREQAQLERELAVALAGPRSTARLVGAMPVIAVLFGALLGFDTVHTLFFTPPGLACLGLGTLLVWAAGRWSASLVRRAARDTGGLGLTVELAAIAMTGGMAAERARALAAGAAERYLPAAGGIELAVVDAVLALSRRAGVPAGELLRSEARQARLRERSAGQQRAARLGVSLMIPLGLCVLPAFMLLGVLPLLLSVLSSTLRLF